MSMGKMQKRALWLAFVNGAVWSSGNVVKGSHFKIPVRTIHRLVDLGLLERFPDDVVAARLTKSGRAIAQEQGVAEA